MSIQNFRWEVTPGIFCVLRVNNHFQLMELEIPTYDSGLVSRVESKIGELTQDGMYTSQAHKKEHTFLFTVTPQSNWNCSRSDIKKILNGLFGSNSEEVETTFEVGDTVTWNEKMKKEDAFSHLEKEYGDGPFIVRGVKEIPENLLACGHFPDDGEHAMCSIFTSPENLKQTAREAAGHHQLIRIRKLGNKTLSGAWFVLETSWH